jgi:cell wall-associated NlpC family hydrolase
MLKNKVLNILLLFVLVIALDSCTTLKNVSSTFKTNFKNGMVSKQKDSYDQSFMMDTSSIDFLDNISVTPGSNYIKNGSGKMVTEKKNNMATKYDVMPSNLSEGEKLNWLQLKYSLRMDIPAESITNIPLLKKIDEWWGTPYSLGGSTKNGVDCSYFTFDVMKEVYKVNLKRTAAEQYDQSSKIEWNNLKEGDLIFFKTEGRRNISHVGIYLANNKFAHASTSQGVTISDLADPYWQRRLYSLGRVAAQN